MLQKKSSPCNVRNLFSFELLKGRFVLTSRERGGGGGVMTHVMASFIFYPVVVVVVIVIVDVVVYNLYN